eukprot:5911155-Ditylum_brightwellii.AAC.1
MNGVIKQIHKQQSYEYDYSFHTLDPDWDIIAQICSVLQSSSIEDEFIHVKGHQDDETPYEQLDLPARMNID